MVGLYFGLSWTMISIHFHNLTMFKYADDTNLLVQGYADVSSTVEFSHIKRADSNGLIIGKTKELVLHRPQSSSYNNHDLPQSLEGIERVQTAKRLGVITRPRS